MLKSKMKSKYSTHASHEVRWVSCFFCVSTVLKALAKQSQCAACNRLLRQPVIYSQRAAADEDLKNNCSDQ